MQNLKYLILLIITITAHSQSVMEDSLISYWSFEETSGTRYDDRDTDNDLSVVTDASYDVGKIGNAYKRSTTGYLTVASNPTISIGDETFTFSGWAYCTNAAIENGVVAKWNSSLNKRQYGVLQFGTPKKIGFLVSGNGTTFTQVLANDYGAPVDNVWYFFIAWHDADVDSIYIQVNNGVVNSAYHAGGVFASDQDLMVGTFIATTYLFNGRIDEIGFWKRVLTPAERSWLYNSGSGRSYTEITQYTPIAPSTATPQRKFRNYNNWSGFKP